MQDIPVQAVLLAIFALIVILAIAFRARISLQVKNWFNLSASPTTAGDVKVGEKISIPNADIGEVAGVLGETGQPLRTVEVLKGADASGAKIDRIVGVDSRTAGGDH